MEGQTIYLVAQSDWEVHEILSAWSTREAAEKEAARLKAADVYNHEFGIEEFALDVPWNG